MSILIDGYNLLYVVGILGRGAGPGSLERSRLAMLNFLAESLEADALKRTTVVFDAHAAPPGLPRVMNHRGLTVRFAVRYEDADTLIEELIRADSAPKRLTVVSSDHRIQKAARHRRAKAIDSDVWYAEVVRQRQQRQRSTAGNVAQPVVPLLEEDVNYWVRQFGGEQLLDEVAAEEHAAAQNRHDEPTPATTEATLDKPRPSEASELDNPFPAGYAEDLLREEE